MRGIIIVAHKFLTQPDDDLVVFLNSNRYPNVVHIRHSFYDAEDRYSYFSWYKNGKLYREVSSKDYFGKPEIIIYIKEFYYTLKWIFFSKMRWDYYIGMDGLCAYWGNILRFCGKVRKTIFWAIDFVPKRFDNKIKNGIYHLVNISSYKKCDEMWDLSPRMAEAREKFLGVKKSDYKSHRVVPYGVWINRIKKYSYEEGEKDTLVFMGHLLEKQGVQLVIKAIPKIAKRIPDFRFKIIGTGEYKNHLIKLAKDLGVIQYCDFEGKIKDIKELEQEIARSALAIAPYIKALDSWSYYGDPGKVKSYLACGVPVLLTDIPWHARAIEANRCGIIITESEDDIVSKIILLMKKEINQKYRENAIRYSQSFNYDNIFNNLINL